MPTIELTYKGAKLEVEFIYEPAQRGLRESTGAQITPDEPETLIAECVKAGGVDITELIEPHLQAIEAQILEEIR